MTPSAILHDTVGLVAWILLYVFVIVVWRFDIALVLLRRKEEAKQ